ncbi:hypothetical protein [Enterobacillus tribolii]|uniref:Uncharacterized protein n=1 Tax=Enterobacillus tribolii TaxID=1487935 RepID=A0A370QUH3_9GAMM|nr:hypothetical protein [Enterobacillus tribolii]MBW7981046.1 hypothetical protein [Enterobacillus tribolii]RDK92896.1 hypothetical protein C8D90_103289 [Enterobacillus tribolii]
MRELNRHEVEEVSGAGIIADAGAALGLGIGKIVDACNDSGTKATEAGTALGQGIGQVIEASLNTVSNAANSLGGLLGGFLGGLFGFGRR